MFQLRTTLMLAAMLAIAAYSGTTTKPPPHPQLIWSDEFNGTNLDARCWARDVEAPPWDPVQRVAFTNSTRNASLSDGALHLTAYRETVNMDGRVNHYSSAQLWTRDLAAWTYGYFEARIKMPAGQGAFPAFWLMPQGDEYGHWPHSGEIDIVENIGREPNLVHTTVHYADAHGEHTSATHDFSASSPLADGYHTYGFEWRPGLLRWYFDNRLVFEQTRWPNPSQTRPHAPFDMPFYMIFDLAVGGGWAQEPDADTQFPMRMDVDWVRIYALPGVTESNGQRLPESTCPTRGPS